MQNNHQQKNEQTFRRGLQSYRHHDLQKPDHEGMELGVKANTPLCFNLAWEHNDD